MDVDALLGVVNDAVGKLQVAWNLRRPESPWGEADYETAREDVLRAVPALKMIAARFPGAPTPDAFEPQEQFWEFAECRDAALRLQGLLRVNEQVTSALETQGPTLASDQLHTWVRESAIGLWNDGHHRNAIQAAAAQVEARLQAKISREDVSGVALIREAFTLNEPEPGKARLRFAWLKKNSEAYKSRHQGAMDLGTGVFQVIRNSASHGEAATLSEPVALEHLACVSFFARLVDSATIASVESEMHEAEERPFG